MLYLVNKLVKHVGMLGVGKIIEQDEKHITVQFASKTSKFLYPAAFEKFLVLMDPSDQDAIVRELSVTREAEEICEKEAENESVGRFWVNQPTGSKHKGNVDKEHTPIKRVSDQALTYLVFQGTTYMEERMGQFIWAPKYTKDGRTMHHWDRLMDLRAGDVIFHCSDGYIQAISRVNGMCEDSARPDHTTGDWTNWEKDGRRVDCDYHVLKIPLKHGAYKEKIREYCNVKYAPFDKDGNGNMGYLFNLNHNLATFFIQEISRKNPEIVNVEFLRFLL